MKYALLCYNSEAIVDSWSKQEDDAVMARLTAVNDRLIRENKMGPIARLTPTSAARTLRKPGKGRRLEPGDRPPVVVDGPFAETKEQLGGFYMIECDTIDQAIEAAKMCPGAKYGSVEVRPVMQVPSRV